MSETVRKTSPRLNFHVAPEASRLLRARERIRDYLTTQCADPAIANDVVLAVEEACTNAILHSGSAEEIEIVLGFEDDDLVAAVKDQGRGFDTDAFDPDALPDPLLDHGRGLFLISRLSDEMEIRSAGGTEVRLVKRAVERCPAPSLETGLGVLGRDRGPTRREERMRALLEEIDEGFIALDWDYRYVYANETSLRMAHVSRDELVGRTPFELLPSLSGTEIERMYRDAMELGKPSVTERVFPVTGDWVETRVYPTPAGVSVYFREINERKRAEEERGRLLEASLAQAAELRSQAAELSDQATELRTQATELRSQAADLAARARLAEVLNAIDRLVHSARDADEIMQRALDEGARALAADAGSIEMREGSYWVLGYQYGLAAADVGLRQTDAEAPNATRAAAGRDPFATADAGAEADFEGSFMQARSLRAVLAVPLIAHDAVTGSLLFYGREPRVFGEAEIDFGRKLGASVSLAIENGRLYEAQVEAERRAGAELRNADLLLKSAKLLASGLDLQAVLDTLASVVLDALPHSRVTVQLWDAASRTLTIVASHGARPASPGTEIAIDQASPAFRDMLTRKVTAVTDFDALPDGARGVAGEFASRLHLGVPLLAGRELIGVLVVDDPGERRPFTGREITLLEAIAAQAATAIRNAALYEEQLHIATTLQENLLHPLPAVAGLDLGTVSQPAFEPERVGGDFSDVFLLADGRVAVLIGDVAGKGVRAAGLTETVRSTVRAFATIDSSPGFVLRKTNEALLRYDSGEPHVTAFLGVLDVESGHVGFASAGHPAPVHLGPSLCRPLAAVPGPPLGTFASDYVDDHVRLTLDDYLMLYTDGVTEARRDDELFGERRLIETVAALRGRSAQALAEGVLEAVDAFAGRLGDDLQVVCLRLA